ncbi:S1/P1 nuclease [Salinisphaera sp.]|uniref:S1/P1 nuclease n=1 Tax=Salinisphaera sp. TaxID=1914330 RepID=UPI002D76F4D0|nr:S1/P1 nuclease [Salinisphaera sp.]HET7314504.1 S1/P1 nuclease [Salinisphaera sp.]
MPATILKRLLTTSAILIFAWPSAALAWGPQGHALIADIAARHLSAAARREVTRLLAIDDAHGLDRIASWADAARRDRPGTGPWHYVDIPLTARGYKAQRDCPRAHCVVARIPYYARILGDRSATSAQRLEALKFVVHFVADIQQPLHAENHHDAGGNDVDLTYFGDQSNLHALWDSGILEHALHLHVGRHFSIDYGATRAAARRLDSNISLAEHRRWTRVLADSGLARAAVHWANQAHALARRVAYANLGLLSGNDGSARYQRQAWPVIRRQLERGGIRLAATLDAVLGKP